MSLGKLVLEKGTGTAAPFTVEAGNVKDGNTPVLVWFGADTALISMAARKAFATAEHMAHFDAMLAFLMGSGKSVLYPTSIEAFMDPKARFTEWLDGKLDPASVGLTLTKAETAVPAAFASAKAKFKALFTPPAPPRILDTRPVPDSRRLITRTSRGSTSVSNGSYTRALSTCRTIWNRADPLWAKTAVDASTRVTISPRTSSGGNSVRIYSDRIEIGCQTIQRNVVEAFAKEQGWLQ
jgi:hypothetical protein